MTSSSSNDLVILEQVLEQNRTQMTPDKTAAEYFEYFVSEQVLKDFDLSVDEIRDGIVDGPADGGIDAIYMFINGGLLREGADFSNHKKEILIEVVIIQAKTAATFSESAMDKLNAAIKDLFSLGKSLETLKSVYNQAILEKIGLFRECHKELAARFPKLKFQLFYGSKGDLPHPNVKRKADSIKTTFAELYSSNEFSFVFLGARDLLVLARAKSRTTFSLVVAENPISSGDTVGFICLVRIRDYFKFITNEKGKLQRHIFEANVRDYQGQNEVNKQINETLSAPGGEDFWWLNNGVTILASQANSSGKTIQIENPEIVNGLQTSNEIFNFFESAQIAEDKRTILVRVIVPSESRSRDRIIRATNSQTNILAASLRSTNKIHRDIEDYLKPHGYFYDRRKNFYRNEGKPIDKIVSISTMAQAIESMVIRRPDLARGRPSSLLRDEKVYDQIFASELPIDLYLKCFRLLQRIDIRLREFVPKLDAAAKGNLRFHSLMALGSILTKNSRPTSTQLNSINCESAELNSDADTAINLVKTEYDNGGSNSNLMKSLEFVRTLEAKIEEYCAPKRP